ncbi:hypothetical protein ACRAWC_21985 [Leifsonia sp. L25]|uniref:hypothetical protein n=1 Tax=Leifsonia sp. L25 TaxID=3423957 RepID=UPI003D6821B4
MVVDGEGSEVSPGVPGRVAIASYMNAEAYDSGPIPSVQIDGVHYILTADIGMFASDGALTILGRASLDAAPSACGDLVGFENDLHLLSGVEDAAVAVEASNTVTALLASATADIDPSLLEYLAIRVGRLRGVDLPISAHVVPRLSYSSTGKFDLASSLSTIRDESAL